MFTGIIEEVGSVERILRGQHSAILHIRAQTVPQDLKIGDSVAVNGVCLTVVSFHAQGFAADVMHETLNRSALKHLRPASPVNLERAMPANGRFGGHIVSGHVDGTGVISKIERDDNAIWYTIEPPSPLLRYIVEKGSVTIDGISLTVAAVTPNSFSISAIPHTVESTRLKGLRVGDSVNLETDILGKYIEKFLSTPNHTPSKAPMTREFLAQCGY